MLGIQSDLKILSFDTDAAVQTRISMFLRGGSGLSLCSAINRETAFKIINNENIDVILLSVAMANSDGIELSKLIRRSKPTIKIIMMAPESDDEQVLVSLTAFANGFCLKETTADRLRAAIQWVATGGLWFDAGVAKSALKEARALESSNAEIKGTNAAESFTADELNVLKALSKGTPFPDVLQQAHLDQSQYRGFQMNFLRKLSTLAENSKSSNSYLSKLSAGTSPTKKLCLACGVQYADQDVTCLVDGTRLVAVRRGLVEGAIIANKYKLGKALARGGNGVIFPAVDLETSQRVAVKVMHEEFLPNPTYVERFRREAETLASLKHPHIVRLVDYGIEVAQAFLVMEFVQGMNLSQVLTRVGEISYERAIPIFIQVCDALQLAHDRGLIHRDLSPANVVLDAGYVDMDFAKVIDFGLVKVVEQPGRFVQRLTRTGIICGTPTYMSPEQCQGKAIDFRSDIYSMGCLMYEVLTGMPPLMGSSIRQTMYSHLHAQPQSMRVVAPDAHIPEMLDQLVLTALQKDPAERQESMSQLKEELYRIYEAHTA